jgi:nucleotide-binding universal stress UspA family protein
MSKPIVVGIDNNPDSAVALSWATAEAARLGSPLMILHVDHAWSPAVRGTGAMLQAQRTHGQELVEQAHAVVQATNRDISVSSLVVPGDPADVLISWSIDASMLVLGSSERTRLMSAVRGPVGAKVAAQASCPVIIARTPPAGHSAPVVLGVDGSAASEAATEFAFDYAAKAGTGVRAVHAWHRSVLPGSGDIGTQRRAHLRVVTEALAAAADRHPDVPTWVVSSTGGANDVLSYESMTAQLIVTGSHGHGLRSGLLLGSASQALLHTASCPLAIIPAKDR